jgi:hypothetical protein
MKVRCSGLNFLVITVGQSQKDQLYIGTAYKHMMMRMEGRVADGVYIGAIPPEIIDSAIENIKKGINKRENPNQHVHINSFWGWHIKKDKERLIVNLEESWLGVQENLILNCSAFFSILMNAN